MIIDGIVGVPLFGLPIHCNNDIILKKRYHPLFYQGEKSPYPYSMDFIDCFEDRELAQALYGQPFPLIDLTVMSDETIMEHRSVAVLELVQKHIRDRDLLELLELFMRALEVSQPRHELFRSLIY